MESLLLPAPAAPAASGGLGAGLPAKLTQVDGKRLAPMAIKTSDEAEGLARRVREAELQVG